jgi:hypothetical protein
MRRLTMVGLCLGACAISAIAASSASAKKSVLTLSADGMPLAAGAPVTATSTNSVFTTSAGNIECTSTVLSGPLLDNSEKKDKSGAITISQTGTEPGGGCKTTTAFGYAVINQATTRKTSFLEWAAFLEFVWYWGFYATFPEAEGLKCGYEGKKIENAYNVGGPMLVTDTEQKFKLIKGSNKACPKEGKLSGEAYLTSEGSPVEASL